MIAQQKVNNYSLLLSESQYDLRSLNKSEDKVAVVYRATVDLPIDAERSFSCWFKELPALSSFKDNVKGGLALGAVTGNFQSLSFKLGVNRKFSEGDHIKITKFNGFTVYGEWQSTSATTSGYNYTIRVKKEIIEFLNLYYPNWASSSGSGYVAQKIEEHTLFDGYDKISSQGLRIGIYANRFFEIKRNAESHTFILKNNLVEEYWYAIFVNMSNFYRQLTVDLWVRKWNESNPTPAQTTDLENIYNLVQPIVPMNMTINKEYSLIACDSMITNIRLYDRIETEQNKQINMLNQTIVKDAQFSIIIDNAVPRLNLPWIANTK